MTFTMYSSNWTERSMHYRKLLLLNMRMNAINNMAIRLRFDYKENNQFRNVFWSMYNFC